MRLNNYTMIYIPVPYSYWILGIGSYACFHSIPQKTFYARMVAYASHVIGRGTTASTTAPSSSSTAVDMDPGLGAELDPQAQVTLYHLATVMNTLVQNSSSVVQLLRANFTEEFRQV